MKKIIKDILGSTLIIAFVAMTTFVAYEPNVSQAIEDQFTVTQTITSEISFIVASNDVTMSPNLGGITGGTSNGTTGFRILTNNDTGFNVTLTASSTASGNAMQGDVNGGSIPNFGQTATTVPEYVFSVGANAAAFGYTVTASTTSDIAQGFLDNGVLCNTGVGDTAGACWAHPSTTARTIINRTTATTASGATSTIAFRVTINANPSPAIPEDTYVATSTLTAVTN